MGLMHPTKGITEGSLEMNLPELVQEVQFRFSNASKPELNLTNYKLFYTMVLKD